MSQHTYHYIDTNSSNINNNNATSNLEFGGSASTINFQPTYQASTAHTPSNGLIQYSTTHNNNNNNNTIANESSVNFSRPPIAPAVSSVSFAQYDTRQSVNGLASSTGFGLSAVETAILRSTVPIDLNETEEIIVNGQRGIWANKSEACSWRGDLPLSDYQINEDSVPEVVTKRSTQSLQYVQEMAIRYLRPPTPPAPGEIVISQEANVLTPPAPPVVLRQQPPRPATPEPLVIREAPPPAPNAVGRKVITISGKRIPPPPRKVVIERLAPIPTKPQSVIIERWLPYNETKRRVIFQKSQQPDPVVVKPRNVIIQWEAPPVQVKKEFKYLGIIRANPADYVARYGSSLKSSTELPEFVTDIKPPSGMVLAADYRPKPVYELEGDVHALSLIDLEKEGLSEYKSQVYASNSTSNYATTTPQGSPNQQATISSSNNNNISTVYVHSVPTAQSTSSVPTYQVQIQTKPVQQQQTYASNFTSKNVFNPDCSEYQNGNNSTTTNNNGSVNSNLKIFTAPQATGSSATLITNLKSPSNANLAMATSSTTFTSANVLNPDCTEYGSTPAPPFSRARYHQQQHQQQQQQPKVSWSIKEETTANDDLLRRIFELIDVDENGCVKYEEAQRILKILNERFNRNYDDRNARNFMNIFDRNHDGSVDFKEFKQSIRYIMDL